MGYAEPEGQSVTEVIAEEASLHRSIGSPVSARSRALGTPLPRWWTANHVSTSRYRGVALRRWRLQLDALGVDGTGGSPAPIGLS